MKRIIDSSEVLGTVELPEGLCELCATASAEYDETASRLVIQLDAFLRTADYRSRERKLSAGWLPKAEVVTESVGPEETLELARDIFHRWVRKVREAAPSLHGQSG